MKQQTDNKQVSSHTPGEWIITDEKNQFNKWKIIVDEKDNEICSLPCYKLGKESEKSEVLQNANLIASAPTLKTENEKLKEDNRLLVESLHKLKNMTNNSSLRLIIALTLNKISNK
jgi:hypothetical protein